MMLKGTLFWAEDIPAEGVPHFAVIVSQENEHGEVLIIPISSIKFSKTGQMEYNGQRCKYYDNACVITPEDIPGIIKKPSFARYQYATVSSNFEFLKKQLQSIFKYKGNVSEELLIRIQNGAKISKEIPERYKKFFDFFETVDFERDCIR